MAADPTPTQEEQEAKEAEALGKLQDFVVSHGERQRRGAAGRAGGAPAIAGSAQPLLAAPRPALGPGNPSRTRTHPTGGTWEEGWTCRMRFRVTNRRNGKLGRTTDNVSPRAQCCNIPSC